MAVTSAVNFVNVALTQVPQEACNKLTTKISRGANFQSTTINAGTAIVGEVSGAVAQAQCTASNTITWATTS